MRKAEIIEALKRGAVLVEDRHIQSGSSTFWEADWELREGHAIKRLSRRSAMAAWSALRRSRDAILTDVHSAMTSRRRAIYWQLEQPCESSE